MLPPERSPFAPIPGTSQAPRALFVKRWGTLLQPTPEGFAGSPEDLRFYEGAVEALFRACRAGWLVYVIGNEEAVASGRLSVAAFEAVQEAFHLHLQRFGVRLARDYTCIDHPEGIAGRQNDSVYLLPNTGAFFHAAHNDGVDLAKSWVLGDSTVDLVAGWRAGLRLGAVGTGQGLADGTFHVDPELRGQDLAHVVHQLLASQMASWR